MKICDKCKCENGVNSYKVNAGMYYIDDSNVKFTPQIDYAFDLCSKCWACFKEYGFYRIILNYIRPQSEDIK